MRRNVRLDQLDYDRAEEIHLCSPSLRCKVKSFLPDIDHFIASLDQRLQAYKPLAGRFGCFGYLSTLSPKELQAAAKTLVDSYTSDLDNSFVDELCHFAMFADIFKDDEAVQFSSL